MVSQPQRESGVVPPRRSRTRQLGKGTRQQVLRRGSEGGHQRRLISDLRFSSSGSLPFPLLSRQLMKAFHLGFVAFAVYLTEHDKLYGLLSPHPSYLILPHFAPMFKLILQGRLTPFSTSNFPWICAVVVIAVLQYLSTNEIYATLHMCPAASFIRTVILTHVADCLFIKIQDESPDIHRIQ